MYVICSVFRLNLRQKAAIKVNGIQNLKELEFLIFVIENTAKKLGVDATALFDALTQKSDILYGYLLPSYDVLHTQGKEYIVDDLIETMQIKGVCV